MITKRYKVRVTYPWPGVSSDECEVLVGTQTEPSETELQKVLFDHAEEMIFNRGVKWTFEELPHESK